MTPSNRDIIEALPATYLALCRALSVDPVVRIGDERDIVWGMTPIPLVDLNRVTGIRLDAAVADRRLAALDRLYRAAGVTPSWWVDRDATPTDLGPRLQRLGYVPYPDLVPAMGIDLGDLPPLIPPDEAQLSFADDRPTVEISQRLFAEGYGLSIAAADALARGVGEAWASDSGQITVAVASVDGHPAATALAVTTGDTAGIYMVATLEPYRGRGLGRAVTLAVLHDAAARGAHLGVLESSVLGYTVYRRIGMMTAGRTRVYVSPPQPASSSDSIVPASLPPRLTRRRRPRAGS